ncbi:MAG: phosphoglucomutase/phosphomannomutase family protein [Chloroflexi bacterium]|uniref:Phosphomannomutase n=1 Tax=Candidatus Thermofonsia Clade 3 bacterium TaxID=2364212 RepID=A0A2M8QCX9_9CHLR|nr:MAG: phosphomannomutase [Candidatus Thermofonsia Clade 3 bacterium]RMG65993.1 MAG: phosphoglucomutase/phosphomannomutase family protein [Chloroflexota bacterium]
MIQIKFGTDGWRGRIADDYTFANVRRCAEGYARYILTTPKAAESSQPSVVIGYDRRFQSENFAAAAAEVLAGHGLKVWLTDGATPTPVIAFAVSAKRAIGAINITASHNPPQDNGFKVRNHTGGAIAPDGLAQIEAAIPASDAEVKRLDFDKALSQGLIERFDPSVEYIANLERLVDLRAIANAGLKVLVDPMWGNGAGWLPRLIGGAKTEVVEIHSARNPIFPEMTRPEPIPPNVNVALARTKEIGANCCCITDGDADRCGFGDECGGFINQLRAYALLALYLLEIRGERGAIVKTLSTTSMLNKLGERYGVPVYETGVGFKYVAPKMTETNAMIGGEESGGYAFRGNVPERDGILANLYFLDLQVRTGKTPTQLIDWLFEKVGPHYYDRVDSLIDLQQREAIQARLRAAQPATIAGLKVVGKDMTDGYKFLFEDGGWLLIRMSGTEPLMRVYCETREASLVEPVLQDGIKIAHGA